MSPGSWVDLGMWESAKRREKKRRREKEREREKERRKGERGKGKGKSVKGFLPETTVGITQRLSLRGS